MLAQHTGSGRLRQRRGGTSGTDPQRDACDVIRTVRLGLQSETRRLTAQVNPRVIYRRAIEHDNLLLAEASLRERGPTLLVAARVDGAERADGSAPAPSVRRPLVSRYLQEDAAVALDDLQALVGLLDRSARRVVAAACTGPGADA